MPTCLAQQLSYLFLTIGCSKCLKIFPRDQNNRADYSGYHYDEWPLRNRENHKNLALDYRLWLQKKK